MSTKTPGSDLERPLTQAEESVSNYWAVISSPEFAEIMERTIQLRKEQKEADERRWMEGGAK